MGKNDSFFDSPKSGTQSAENKDGKVVDTPQTDVPSTFSANREEVKPSDIVAGERKPMEDHLKDMEGQPKSNFLPKDTSPIGEQTIDESHSRADKSVIGNTSPEFRIRTSNPAKLQRIERVLRDGGMDTMSTIKALQAIGEIMDSDEPTPGEAYDKAMADAEKVKREDGSSGTPYKDEDNKPESSAVPQSSMSSNKDKNAIPGTPVENQNESVGVKTEEKK